MVGGWGPGDTFASLKANVTLKAVVIGDTHTHTHTVLRCGITVMDALSTGSLGNKLLC